MIAPQELRIENWVYDRSKTRIVKVWGIESNHDQITVNHANGSAIYKVNLKDLEPIELTEDWLEKFGFKQHSVKPFYYLEVCNDWTRIYYDPTHHICELSISGHSTVLGKITCVHQLQNLSSALGEELTIKEHS